MIVKKLHGSRSGEPCKSQKKKLKIHDNKKIKKCKRKRSMCGWGSRYVYTAQRVTPRSHVEDREGTSAPHHVCLIVAESILNASSLCVCVMNYESNLACIQNGLYYLARSFPSGAATIMYRIKGFNLCQGRRCFYH